jgi:hypothetical protein
MVIIAATRNSETIKYSDGSIVKRLFDEEGFIGDVVLLKHGHRGKAHIESVTVPVAKVNKGD